MLILGEGRVKAVLFEIDTKKYPRNEKQHFSIDRVWAAWLKSAFRTVDLQNTVLIFCYFFIKEKVERNEIKTKVSF